MLLFDMKTLTRFRTAFVVISIASVGAGAVLRGDQDSDRKRTSSGVKKGDTITVKGCLQGSLLQSTDVAGEDGVSLPMSVYTFQLKGKKELLRDLHEKHDGVVVSLTGELKSTITDQTSFGTSIGGTKVVLGGDPRTREQAMQGTSQALPVLDVKSFEGSTVSCKR
jgi:hypothetical protein